MCKHGYTFIPRLLASYLYTCNKEMRTSLRISLSMANQVQIYVPAVSKEREGEFHKRLESWQAKYQDVLARCQAQKAGKICNDICE